MTTVLLAITYPLLLAARLVNTVLGRDPLRRARPSGGSYWVKRDSSPGDAGYFLEVSPSEKRDRSSAGWLPEAVLLSLSRWFAPRRSTPGEKFSATADREQGIPDEMYTLW